MREYLAVIFWGIAGTFLYNYFACFLRAIGNSVTPLLFLAVSAVLNIALDLWFVVGLGRGVAGAAEATVISQYVSGLGLGPFALVRCPELRPRRGERPCPLGQGPGDRQLLPPHLRPAVGDEPGHPHGPGAGQQLRGHGDGGLRRGGEDRRLRLSAGPGLRQRLLHLHRPELRRREAGPHPGRAAGGGPCGYRSPWRCPPWCGSSPGPSWLCSWRRRRPPSSGEGVRYLRIEGAFYCGIGLPVPALRPVPGPGAARDERGRSPSSPWAPGWSWPTSSPPCRPSAWRASGGRCPSAGSWRT